MRKKLIAIMLFSVLIVRTSPVIYTGTCIGEIYPDRPYGGQIETINGKPADPRYNYIDYIDTLADPGDKVITINFYNPINNQHDDDCFLTIDFVNGHLTRR